MKSEHIVIVEDEADIGALMKFHLENEGHTATVIESGRDALERIRQEQPALVILDIMLPDLDGLEICRRLKWDENTRGIPLLIVSAKGEETDIVTGLEMGADDYITKPFSPKVLVARMRNILRRHAEPELAPNNPRNYLELAGGQLVIDLDRHAIKVSGKPVELTRTEFGILQYLASRPGFVRTRDQITSAVHGENAVLTSRTVDVHVTAIRRKLGEVGGMLRTVRGVGYRLDESAANAETRS